MHRPNSYYSHSMRYDSTADVIATQLLPGMYIQLTHAHILICIHVDTCVLLIIMFTQTRTLYLSCHAPTVPINFVLICTPGYQLYAGLFCMLEVCGCVSELVSEWVSEWVS